MFHRSKNAAPTGEWSPPLLFHNVHKLLPRNRAAKNYCIPIRLLSNSSFSTTTRSGYVSSGQGTRGRDPNFIRTHLSCPSTHYSILIPWPTTTIYCWSSSWMRLPMAEKMMTAVPSLTTVNDLLRCPYNAVLEQLLLACPKRIVS